MIKLSIEVQCLGWILGNGLTWKKQLGTVMKKAYTAWRPWVKFKTSRAELSKTAKPDILLHYWSHENDCNSCKSGPSQTPSTTSAVGSWGLRGNLLSLLQW
jgi:hypothetical protein